MKPFASLRIRTTASPPTRTYRCAFTLVELLAVLALSGLLLIALLRATASLGATSRAWDAASQARDLPAAWLDRWRDQLSDELAAARRIEITPGGSLRLVGHFGTRPGALTPTHEPAAVTYRAFRSSAPSGSAVNGDSVSVERVVLRREHRWLLSTTNRAPQSAAVALDLRSVNFDVMTRLPPGSEAPPESPSPSVLPRELQPRLGMQERLAGIAGSSQSSRAQPIDQLRVIVESAQDRDVFYFALAPEVTP